MEINQRYENDKLVTGFIKDFCANLISEIEGYYNDFEENPLQFRERTLSSVVFPAFMNSGKRAAMEIYYYDEELKKRNFLDYYIMDKVFNSSYLVEFKHAWNNNENDIMDKFNFEKWEKVNDQIKKLKKKYVNEYIDSEKEIYGLSIYMLITQSDKREHGEFSYKNHINKVKNIFKDYDWMYVKQWNENCSVIQSYNHDGLFYPYMTLLGKIKKIEKL